MGKKNLSKPKAQKKIDYIRNPFFLNKKKRKRKEIKDRITRDIWTVFETEEEKKRS